MQINQYSDVTTKYLNLINLYVLLTKILTTDCFILVILPTRVDQINGKTLSKRIFDFLLFTGVSI